MQTDKIKKIWMDYRDKELIGILPIIKKLGFTLEETQSYIDGESYLIGGFKLTLIGRRIIDQKRVIIKISSRSEGISEIERERTCRITLEKINFAYHVFFSPEEILFTKKCGYIISVTTFIEQEKKFLELPLEKQFFLALKTFEAQEGAHAVTYEHTKNIRKIFGIWDGRAYLKTFNAYASDIVLYLPDNKKIKTLLSKALEFLTKNSEIINLYSGFLTHWDFVPHNFRIQKRDIYLLDHSSIRFGNKYESWARFINFMTLYNRPLEEALVEYINKNRTKEEFLSLQLMRVFRLTDLIRHYANALQKTSGNLLVLSQKRIEFWSTVLEALLNNKSVNQEIITEYKSSRDILRSEEERQRQKELY